MNYPQIKPTLNLDFSNTKTLDPRINFRRGTPGAYYDGKTYAKAEENLIEYSEDFANAYWSKSNASIISDDIDAPDGTVSSADKIVENTATSTHQISAGGAGTLGKTYTLSYFVKTAERTSCRISFWGEGSAVFNVSTGSVIKNEFLSASIESVGNDWYRVAATVIKTNSNEDVFIGPALDDGDLSYAGDGSSGLYIWGAQIEQREDVTAYTPTDGAPVTKYQPQLMFASPDQPRFDHDVLTGESKGLLIEESRTNLIEYSEDISGARWSQAANFETNVVVAPDGELSGDRIYQNDAIDYQSRNVGFDLVSGVEYVYSIYAKDDNLGYVRINIAGGSEIDYDLTNGTFDKLGNTSSIVSDFSGDMQYVGGGWYRCIYKFTSAYTGYTTARHVAINANGTVQGDGRSGFYIWGAQLEAGSFPTSYIKASGASATRSADNASITGENFSSWYRQDEGSIYSEASTSDFRSSYPRFMINDGTANNRIVTSFFGQQGLRVQSNGNDYINVSNAVSSDNRNYHKRAIALKKDSFSFYTDGESVLSNSMGEMPMSVNTFAFYNNLAADGADYLNGHIKKLSYYPQRLTNEQLQQLTK